MKKTIYILMMLVCLGCKQHLNNKSIDLKTAQKLHLICPPSEGKTIILYDLDGDCAICLAKMDYISRKYKSSRDTVPLFIAETLNPQIFAFNVNKAKIAACIYVDSVRSIAKNFVEGQVWQINTDRTFVVRNDFK